MSARDNRLDALFTELSDAGRKAFIVFLFAGDPDLETTVDLVAGLAAAGVDAIELGIPYSDPMADGPTNQAACERALAAGTTTRGVLDAVVEIRKRSPVPLLLYTYVSPVLAYGPRAFAADAAAAGADGVLFLDLPPEEDDELRRSCRAYGLRTVCLVAPNTAFDRRALLARESGGFLYYVCRLGITGERDALPAGLEDQVADLRALSRVPVCVGFGISTPAQAAQTAACADGVIVGSHLVAIIAAHGRDPDLVERLSDRAGEFARAVHG